MRQFSGPRLRDQRLLAGLSAAQLGERVGRSESTVCRWERGRTQPSISYADAVADALGIRLDVLLADDGPQPAART
ncbi:helix-turn-helix transcriptional regulator [Streptomyces antibioticus]|uniref:helix-turn-helix transcriptional regulator n=1 Tax=Streptomyces antibioticus TaxID=1890 RepID=UPI0036DC3630